MALFQCIQLSKGTTPGHIKGWSGIWRSRDFRGLTPKSNRAESLCDVGASKCHLRLQSHFNSKKHSSSALAFNTTTSFYSCEND